MSGSWTPEAIKLSGELARSLGQGVRTVVRADMLFRPAEGLEDGILETAPVPSRSDNGEYLLVRTAGGWQHVDGRCRGWVFRGTCFHVERKNMETGLVVSQSASVLALIDEIEDSEVAESIRGELTETWIYEFQMGGKPVVGVGSKGVENGCRELAKKGEAIRELDVKVEYEDEQEARFVAQAGRYAVSPDGKEILLDVAIRAKRQAKWEKRRDGQVVFDDNWFEKGVTKAARNAKLALMPDSIVALIISEAKRQGKTRQVQAPQRGQQRQVNAPPERGDITDSTAKHITDAYHKVREAVGPDAWKDEVRAGLQDKWGHAFLNTSNRLAALTEEQAMDVLEFLAQHIPVEPPEDDFDIDAETPAGAQAEVNARD